MSAFDAAAINSVRTEEGERVPLIELRDPRRLGRNHIILTGDEDRLEWADEIKGGSLIGRRHAIRDLALVIAAVLVALCAVASLYLQVAARQ